VVGTGTKVPILADPAPGVTRPLYVGAMRTLRCAAAALVAGGLLMVATPADAKPSWTKNCTALNKKYPHGVGKASAHDHVSSGTPVTSFKHSDKRYKEAMRYNKGLDRDHDKIACEKH
jgi:Excalibur calcium-binding domain